MLYHKKNGHGGDIYGEDIRLDFSANTNPFGTPQGVIDAVAASLNGMHRYPDPYCRGLVKAISEHEQVPGDYILCGNGAAELIYAYCEAVKPERAVELAPTFSEYSLALRRTGGVMERYFLRQENEFQLDERFLGCLDRLRPHAVFLCNPNNPTGKTIDNGLLVKILNFCREENIRLFVDECFLDLADGGLSLKGFLAENPQLFILKAFTKSYGMAGVRLGYCLCAAGTLLEKMAETVQPWNVSSLAQAAGTAALKEQEFLKKTRELVAEERHWLKEGLEKLGFWVCPSEANYLLFEGPAYLYTELKKQGIAVRNCDNYQGLGAGWYRIAVRTHEENAELINAMKSVCKKE